MSSDIPTDVRTIAETPESWAEGIYRAIRGIAYAPSFADAMTDRRVVVDELARVYRERDALREAVKNVLNFEGSFRAGGKCVPENSTTVAILFDALRAALNPEQTK